jgi:hypothetical protein
MCKLLMEGVARANVAAASPITGNTSVHMAVEAGNSDVVKCLLLKTAFPDAKNKKEQTPLDVATLHNHDKITSIIQRKLAALKKYAEARKLHTKALQSYDALLDIEKVDIDPLGQSLAEIQESLAKVQEDIAKKEANRVKLKEEEEQCKYAFDQLGKGVLTANEDVIAIREKHAVEIRQKFELSLQIEQIESDIMCIDASLYDLKKTKNELKKMKKREDTRAEEAMKIEGDRTRERRAREEQACKKKLEEEEQARKKELEERDRRDMALNESLDHANRIRQVLSVRTIIPRRPIPGTIYREEPERGNQIEYNTQTVDSMIKQYIVLTAVMVTFVGVMGYVRYRLDKEEEEVGTQKRRARSATTRGRS